LRPGWRRVGRRGQWPLESPRQLGSLLRHLQAGHAQAAFGGLRFTIYSFKLETLRLAEPICGSRVPSSIARAVKRECPTRFDPSFREHRPRSRADADAGADPGPRAPDVSHVAVSALVRFCKQLDRAVEDIGSVDAVGSATCVIAARVHRATEAIPGVPYPKAVRDYDAVGSSSGGKQFDRQVGAHHELRLGVASTATTRACPESMRTDADQHRIGTFDAPARAVRRRWLPAHSGVWPPTAPTSSRRN
jgi:hypothetical protein